MKIKDVNTLEEAKAELIRVSEEYDKLETEKKTLSQNNEQLTQELNTVRTINQEYYLKITASHSPEEEEEEEEPETPSCEDFAKTINII